MSTLAVNREIEGRPAGAWGYLATRAGARMVGCAGLAAGAGAGVLVATSNHLVQPLAYGLEISIIVAGTVGVALYWAAHRPGNRIAPALLVYAAVAAGIGLQGASQPLLHSVGVLLDAVFFLLAFYVVFIYPQGRLAGALEKALVASVLWVVLVSFLPWFFFSPVVTGGAPLAGCTAKCPTNALMIADRPDVAGGFGKAEDIFAAVVAGAIVLAFAYRLATASRPRRRALLPVYVPALLVAVSFAVFHANLAGLLSLDAATADRVGWILTAGRTALSFGFLLAIWLAGLGAGVALKTIMTRLGDEGDAASLRDLVALALDDPSLQLAFDVERESGLFVDSRGDAFDPGRVAADRRAAALRRRGHTAAYLVHDPALETDPELVQAAGQAVLLALETGRLEAELQSKGMELRRSSGRIVAAAEAERRKIERDLHDGAQQRLLSMQIKLALLRERPGHPELAEAIDELRRDADAAVDELRSLAHGIYPTVLRERGLGDAVHSLALATPMRVGVEDGDLGRCVPVVEASVYFCVLEALQNATKHAGTGARVRVRLQRRGDDLHFEVADDGAGFDPDAVREGFGLVSMRDRIAALGGELEIVSARGRGTSVRGTLPARIGLAAERELAD